MMKQLLLFIAVIGSFQSFSQKHDNLTYLENHAWAVDELNPSFEFDSAFYANQFFMFGFVHGSEKPQAMDLALLKQLHQNGVRYYAPEMSYSLAFIFSQYLKTGDENFLNYGMDAYASRVQQDASVQFKNKWRALYEYNKTLPKQEQIKLLGFDRASSSEVTMTHIAYLGPAEPSGIAIVDSLQYFKDLPIDTISIVSGKPVYKSGKGWDYFFGTGKTAYLDRFMTAYQADSTNILTAFGNHAKELSHIINQSMNNFREPAIYENFKAIGLPLLQKGEKIYANYGYAHLQQSTINNYPYMAKLIKDSGQVKLISVIGMLTNSDCLVNSKVKGTGAIMIKGVKFRQAEYSGYKTSKNYDGDTFFEQVNGMKVLKGISAENDIMLFQLNGENSPYKTEMAFADMSRGGRKWQVEEGKSATDYFQYILLIKNSPANKPLQEE